MVDQISSVSECKVDREARPLPPLGLTMVIGLYIATWYVCHARLFSASIFGTTNAPMIETLCFKFYGSSSIGIIFLPLLVMHLLSIWKNYLQCRFEPMSVLSISRSHGHE